MDDLSAELIAEIDGCEPQYPVPEAWGLQTAEALDHAFRVLGIEYLCTAARLTTDMQGAIWSEQAATILAQWLRRHAVPMVKFWYPSKIAGDWVRFQLMAAA